MPDTPWVLLVVVPFLFGLAEGIVPSVLRRFRSSEASNPPRALGALGLAAIVCGFIAAYAGSVGMPPFPPISSLHKVPYLMVLLAVAAAIAVVVPGRGATAQGLGFCVLAAAMTWLAGPIAAAASFSALSGFALFTILSWVAVNVACEPPASRIGLPARVVQAIPTASAGFGLSLACAAAGSLTYAGLAIAVSAVCTGLATATLSQVTTIAGAQSGPRSASTPVALCGVGGLAILAMGGFLYAEIPPTALLALGACFAMPFLLRPAHDLRVRLAAWRQAGILGLYTLTPAMVCVAVTLAVRG